MVVCGAEEIIQVDAHAWLAYADDPLPGWANRGMSLFDCESAELRRPSEQRVDCAVFSVPFDSTASTRVGARFGPRAIRDASLSYSSQVQSRGAIRLRNMRTGRTHMTRQPALADFGDFHVYPSDPAKQMRATAAETFAASVRAERVLMLGGEHSLSFAGYCGVAAALRQKTGGTVGYLQIDHHFDFGEHSVLHGPYYHGSNARRISEHPSMSPASLAFLGVGDLTSAAQYESMLADGVTVRSIADIRERGFERCLREALDAVASAADHVYVSLDIDVCDTATATGTGHVTVGGITATELLSIAGVLQNYPVVAFDVMEVSPPYDAGGATAHLVARLLFEWLFLDADDDKRC